MAKKWSGKSSMNIPKIKTDAVIQMYQTQQANLKITNSN
jgi:hypothetical protein